MKHALFTSHRNFAREMTTLQTIILNRLLRAASLCSFSGAALWCYWRPCCWGIRQMTFQGIAWNRAPSASLTTTTKTRDHFQMLVILHLWIRFCESHECRQRRGQKRLNNLHIRYLLSSEKGIGGYSNRYPHLPIASSDLCTFTTSGHRPYVRNSIDIMMTILHYSFIN